MKKSDGFRACCPKQSWPAFPVRTPGRTALHGDFRNERRHGNPRGAFRMAPPKNRPRLSWKISTLNGTYFVKAEDRRPRLHEPSSSGSAFYMRCADRSAHKRQRIRLTPPQKRLRQYHRKVMVGVSLHANPTGSPCGHGQRARGAARRLPRLRSGCRRLYDVWREFYVKRTPAISADKFGHLPLRFAYQAAHRRKIRRSFRRTATYGEHLTFLILRKEYAQRARR